jgi:hypothetical protein
VAAVYLQHTANAQLREELALLRQEMRSLAQANAPAARAPHAATAGAVVVAASDHEAARAEERGELKRLREEIRALQASTQSFTRVVQAAAAAKGLDASGAAAKLTPVADWKNAGLATPEAAVETMLWAAVGGDLDALSGAITLPPGARAKAEAMLARLPEAARDQYRTPEHLMALMLAKEAGQVSGMQVLGSRELTADTVVVRVRVGSEGGQTKEDKWPFQRSVTGWKLVMPEDAVDKFSKAIAGRQAGK